ncbi:carbohydrate esterase family 4 protein [Backusella circina FSU 941]|nr:carbohydrate esterase family 4 protein [Backusella circina FSU 941]
MYISTISTVLLVCGTFVSAATTAKAKSTSTSSGILAVESPAWLPAFKAPTGVNSGYPTGELTLSDTLPRETLDLSAYPAPWGKVSTTHPEVKKVIAAIDWTKVPKAPVRKTKANGDIDMTGYDSAKDPYCWWSDSNCVKPKASYLPEDVSFCPNAGDWGLNYDDGPYNPSSQDKELNKWAEPELYNFLAKTKNQKATLFYIGSNVATYPEAAKRALNDGHVLCSHTWSHPQMTTQTNEQVVAELYWTLRAIKEATGITTKCWRPPYGDVDDRVRAIAWQMGMLTYLWDEDTNDWNMPGDGGGNLAPSTVDGYFEGWINKQKSGTDKHGHIVLEHELNNATVQMTEKWLPKLQETFNVVSIHQCMNISQPYWETNWVYPTEAEPNVGANTTTTSSAVPVSTSAIPSVSSVAPAVSSVAPSTAEGDSANSIKNNNAASAASSLQKSAIVPAAIAIGAAAYFF